MRFVVVASLAVLGLAQSAVAADLGPYLRGGQYEEPAAPYRWSGVYGGGQVGYSVAGVEDPGTDVSALVNSGLSLPPFDSPPFPGNVPTTGWTLAGKRNPVGISYGAFVGYNFEYEDALVGFEVNYNHTSLNAVIGNSINAPPFLANTLTYTVNVLATSEKRITDFGTLRVRGGWEVGCFLPYGFIGFALARVDLTRSATVSYTAKDGSGAVVLSGSSPTQFDTRNGVVAYGAAAGLGIDVGLLPNWFLRGEWEFAQFAPIDHHLHAHINTVRTALGVKF